MTGGCRGQGWGGSVVRTLAFDWCGMVSSPGSDAIGVVGEGNATTVATQTQIDTRIDLA